jgi:hypothetical protein
LPQTYVVTITLLVLTIADTAMQKQLTPHILNGVTTESMHLQLRARCLRNMAVHHS